MGIIARVTFRVPGKGQVLIHYYSHYPNVPRGEMRKVQVDPSSLPVIEQDKLFIPSRARAKMIRKIYEVDPFGFYY